MNGGWLEYLTKILELKDRGSIIMPSRLDNRKNRKHKEPHITLNIIRILVMLKAKNMEWIRKN